MKFLNSTWDGKIMPSGSFMLMFIGKATKNSVQRVRFFIKTNLNQLRLFLEKELSSNFHTG